MQTSKYIFGQHAVTSFLQSHPEKVIYLHLQTGKTFDGLEKHIKNKSFKINYMQKEALNLLVGSANHQGIIAEVLEGKQTYSEKDLAQILEAKDSPAFLLILDGVQDPHNLGACLRSANAAGAQAVIAPKDNAVGLTPVVYKVASGAAEVTPFIPVTNLARTLEMIKERGIWLVGLDERADETIFQSDLRIPLALVLGAEGAGLRRLTKDTCDFLVKIPMHGSVPSLNVSVAAGVCLFEVVRQRKLKSV